MPALVTTQYLILVLIRSGYRPISLGVGDLYVGALLPRRQFLGPAKTRGKTGLFCFGQMLPRKYEYALGQEGGVNLRPLVVG